MASADVALSGPVSSIDAASAAGKVWDVIVIGGGLAGSIAARGLAASGCRTLLVERTTFPRPKVCGCCLGSLAARTLDAIGLDGLLDDCAARPLHAVHLRAGDTPARIPLHGVVGLSRETLDQRLAAEARDAGAELLLETRAEATPDGTVRLHAGEAVHEARARVVVLAAGLRSHDASNASRSGRTLLGIGAVVADHGGAYPDGVVQMAIDRAGYVGVAPLEDGRLTIASAIRADAVKQWSPRGAVERILAGAGLGDLVPTEARFTGVPPLRRHRTRVQSGRILAVGDAAGFVEPITGEGMSWAIATGAAVVGSARAMIAGTEAATCWEQAYRRMMPRRHLRCALVGACIRRPGLVRAAVGASALVPRIRATILAGLLGRYDPSIEGELA